MVWMESIVNGKKKRCQRGKQYGQRDDYEAPVFKPRIDHQVEQEEKPDKTDSR